jgi:flagellar biosynthesis protein FlhA
MAVNASTSPSVPVGLQKLLQQSDILLAMAVAAVIGIMIVPLPPFVLDILIIINVAIGLVMLLVSMYIRDPLEFSVFPSLLLIATLYRLGLNIAASRLILLQAHAGAVIEAFGNFVVGGNYIVGVVVFLILVVIQFVVITNGAGRVAEVAARFTLDAMPGKQMSIDADLNAGIITEEEARQRRKAIQQEADFYGAMDGASKFVKGDAIAGIIIIFINILGGFAIGVLQLKMPLIQALQTYTLLTVGDGLVSQIPALLISTATGIIVTRAASEANLGRDVLSQVLANPRALAIVAALLAALGVVPGLPKLPFFVIAALAGATAFALERSRRHAAVLAAGAATAAVASKEEPLDAQAVVKMLPLDPIELEIGYGLIGLADPEQGGNLLSRITLIRKQLALDLGIVVPTIRIRDNLQLPANAYVIKLRGVQVAQGEARAGRYLAMDPGVAAGPIDGTPTREPAFGLPAVWITAELKERAEMLGYTVVDPSSVITTHLTEVLKTHAPSILSRQDVQTLLDSVKATHPALVAELVPNPLSIGDVQKVLQNLLRERVSIRDLVTILETLADHAPTVRDHDTLSELVRQALGRTICNPLLEQGALHAFTLAPQLQHALAESLQPGERGMSIVIEPQRAQRLLQRMAQAMEAMAAMGHQPVAVVNSRIRLPLKRLTERALPGLVILAYQEVPPGVEVRITATVSIDDEG